MADQLHDWKELAAQLRVDSIRCTTAAGSGHPTSSMSAADLMAVLLAKYLRFDWAEPHYPNNDRLIFSKGHACPVLYSMFKAAGAITDQELLTPPQVRQPAPGPSQPARPAATWTWPPARSARACPSASAWPSTASTSTSLPYRVWVVLGDSECAEGSIWEAFDKASYYKLDNLIAILDMNRLGQRGETDLGWNSAAYAARARAFGWHAIELDGHDLTAIDKAYAEALKHEGQADRPRRQDGQGQRRLVRRQQGRLARQGHERPTRPSRPSPSWAANGTSSSSSPQPEKRRPEGPPTATAVEAAVLPARRQGGDAQGLRRRPRRPRRRPARRGGAGRRGVQLDARRRVQEGVSRPLLRDVHRRAAAARARPSASACWASEPSPRRSRPSSRAPTTRSAWPRSPTRRSTSAGSHAGCSIGEDGPSQMALEDLAMMRAVYGSTVLYPCDPNQTAALVEQMVDLPGISYLRTTREKTNVLYRPGELFPVGGARVVKRGDKDRVAVIAAGITVHEALKAYDKLKAEGIEIRIIDAYTVKPIDKTTLLETVKAVGGKLVTVEDHWPEGGLGDAVLDALATEPLNGLRVVKLAVSDMPGSGTPAELMHAAGIDADAILKAVKSLL